MENRVIVMLHRLHCRFGGQACFHSLLGCCIAADVNPREWLTDVLTRIPGYNNDYSQDLAELLPYNWKALQKPEETALKI